MNVFENKKETLEEQTKNISMPESEDPTEKLLNNDQNMTPLFSDDCDEKTAILTNLDDNQDYADLGDESSKNQSRPDLFSNKSDHFVEEESTEPLVDEVSLKSQKHKKRYLILGAVTGVCVLAALAFFIPTQMKASEINKSLELGEKYLEEGKYEEAIIAFDDVIAIEPKQVSAYEGKGSANIGLKNYAEAEAQLETAKSIDYTDNGKALMSDVYINTERKDLAKSLLDELINHTPEETRIIVYVSKLYSQLNEYNKVIELLEKKITNTTDKEELKKLFNELINIYAKSGKTEAEILTLLERAAKTTDDQSYLDKKASYSVKIPSFSLAPGEYKGAQTLEISKGTTTDKVYYTIDCSDPSTTSTEYSTPISLQPGEMTIKIIAVNEAGVKSPIQESKYVVKQSNLTNEEFINKIYGIWYKSGENEILNITNSNCYILVNPWSGGGNYEVLSTTENGGLIRIPKYFDEGKDSRNQEFEFDFGTPGDNIISFRSTIPGAGQTGIWYQFTAAEDLGSNQYRVPSDLKSQFSKNGIVTLKEKPFSN